MVVFFYCVRGHLLPSTGASDFSWSTSRRMARSFVNPCCPREPRLGSHCAKSKAQQIISIYPITNTIMPMTPPTSRYLSFCLNPQPIWKCPLYLHLHLPHSRCKLQNGDPEVVGSYFRSLLTRPLLDSVVGLPWLWRRQRWTSG